MLRVGVIGARGYTGEGLIDILLKHPRVRISYLTARVDKPVAISGIFPKYKGRLELECDNFDIAQALKSCDLAFLALPHTSSMCIVPLLIAGGKKVIDLSADYRIADCGLYEARYKVSHRDKNNLHKAVYGLSEIYKSRIAKADLIANPGCYPTAGILAAAPLLKYKPCSVSSVIIDAKSGYSGAGRKSKEDAFWQNIKDNFKAYKVDDHQHIPEFSREFSLLAGKKIKITFVPHLLPIERGILETLYLRVSGRPGLSAARLVGLYKKFYKNRAFVRIKKEGEYPEIKDVVHTNFCDIGIKVSGDGKLIILISAIDNLIKGASGQAVQNMNLMCGFKETEGLL